MCPSFMHRQRQGDKMKKFVVCHHLTHHERTAPDRSEQSRLKLHLRASLSEKNYSKLVKDFLSSWPEKLHAAEWECLIVVWKCPNFIITTEELRCSSKSNYASLLTHSLSLACFNQKSNWDTRKETSGDIGRRAHKKVCTSRTTREREKKSINSQLSEDKPMVWVRHDSIIKLKHDENWTEFSHKSTS